MSLGSDLSARLSAARETEAGIAGSGWYTKLDSALAEKLQVRAARNAVLHARKNSMLLVDAASDDTLRIIEDLFPTFNRVSHVLYSTLGSDVEALRSAIYTSLFDEIVAEGAIIHVGGFQDTHVVHGRHVHCEQTISGPMEYSRAIRRFCVREQLYRNATAVKLALGRDKLPWAMLAAADDSEHNCPDPKLCTLPAGYMVFDINVIPLSQQQVCAAMLQHKCELAQALILVEDNSSMGASGYIAGTKIRAEYDAVTGMIDYSSDQGGSPEFPSIRKSVLTEWMTVSARHEYGNTFFFEVIQHYGPFSKVQITRVAGLLPVKITHRTWNINASRESGPMRVVTVPKLKDLSLSSDSMSNYETMVAVIREKTYEAAHTYALTLAANDFRKGNIRRKLNELTNRVIVKGTSVEIVEPLHPDVADIVSLELFVKCYVERFDSSQVFKHITAEISDVRRSAHDSRVNLITKALGAGMRAAQDWWSDTVTDNVRRILDALIRERVNMPVVFSELSVLFAQHTTELRGVPADYGIKAPVDGMGGYFQMIMSKWSHKRFASDPKLSDGPSDDDDDRDGDDSDNAEHHGDQTGLETLGVDDVYTPSRIDPFLEDTLIRGIMPQRPLLIAEDGCSDTQIVRDFRQATTVGVDPLEDPEATRLLSLDPALAKVVSEVNVRADMGPDGSNVTWTGERIELVMALDDHEQKARAVVDVDDFITVLCEQYSNCFPAVAAADMSADYDLLAHGDMYFNVNVPFLRMPQDNIVGSERIVFKSRLNGPNRPNAPSESRNLLMGVIKRNADPHVLKLPEDSNIAGQMWENFLSKRCAPDVREKLASYQGDPALISLPNLMQWAARVGSDKVDKVVKLLEADGDMMMEKSLNEFLLQFKGKVKPTVSAGAAQSCPKFQTIMHYTTDINMYWSAIFSDLTLRYNTLLAPHIHVGVRGNDEDKLNHIRTHHPWGDDTLVYVQLDMSEYDKSQEGRARDFYDIMHKSLGLSEEFADAWSKGQTTNVARSMALGIKLIVPLQMKSGIATTLWGNSAYSQAIAAWLMPDVVYELGQGDDLYDVLEEHKFTPSGMVEKAAAVFNMPLKLICQRVMPMRTGYFCGKFVVYDNSKKEVFLIPDPIKAIEGLSRPITLDEAKFAEMYQSFRDRMVAWKSDFPTQTFDHMVSRWYEAPDLEATTIIDALLSAGKTAETFRTMWDEFQSKVK